MFLSSGVHPFWAMLNSQPIIDTLDKLSAIGKSTSISCFDSLPSFQRYLMTYY